MSISLFSLEGKVALVRGGNGGLGRAIALGLREAGARVAVTGRNSGKNEAIAAELGDVGAVLALDVRDEESVVRVIDGVISRLVGWTSSSTTPGSFAVAPYSA